MHLRAKKVDFALKWIFKTFEKRSCFSYAKNNNKHKKKIPIDLVMINACKGLILILE